MKATHDGHCQLCGRLQRLPSGELAKHGYTKEWGFFSGTCPGSEYAPYEKSCGEITRRIPAVAASVAAQKEVIAALVATPFKADDVRLNVYAEKLKYHWIQTQVRFKRHESSVGSGWWYTCEGLVPNRRRNEMYWATVETYGHSNSESEILRYLTDKYIASLQKQLAQSEEYLNWLTKREADWVETECAVR